MARVLVEYSQRLQQAVDAALGTPSLSVDSGRRARGRSALTDAEEASSEIAIGVLVSGPSNGYGPAVWKAIKVNADGTWTATGEEVPVVVPLLK